MKRIFVLCAALAALAAFNTPTPALAAAGCGTHQVAITDWIEVGGQAGYDSVDVSFDFQCGGTTSNYRLVFHLQEMVNGSWVQEGCGGPGSLAACTVYRPDSTHYYTSGTEHGCLNAGCGPDFTWHPSTNIEGQWFRVQAVVHFANGDPNLTYYSQERQL